MVTRVRRLRALRIAAVLLAGPGLVLVGCGNRGESGNGSSATPKVRSAAAEAAGTWLIRLTTSSGPDGETTGAVYVLFDPTSGRATVTRLPGLSAPDAYAGAQSLLVSADHRYAVLDSRISPSQTRSGRLRLYSVADGSTTVLPIRDWARSPALRAIGWSFDPSRDDVIRVVDADRGIWVVDLAAHTATRQGQLPARKGWIFGSGFDKNTGLPYLQSVETGSTDPAGNGDADVRPIKRAGGMVFYDDNSGATAGGTVLPPLPCGFSGGFTLANGNTWLFCADTPRITAYRHVNGAAAWTRYGKSSNPVVPGTAEDLPFVLPPV